MSFMKETLDIDARMQRLAIARKSEEQLREAAELENLERLKWEVDHAVANLFEAISRREQRRAAAATRKIEDLIQAGERPF